MPAESPAPSFVIEAPASTANFGPGFDCFSAAIDVANYMEVTVAPSESISVSHFILDENQKPLTIPMDEDLTISGVTDCLGVLGHSMFDQMSPVEDQETIAKFHAELAPLVPEVELNSIASHIHIATKTKIPFSRGMGSSTAAYQGGILVALAVVYGKDVLMDTETQGLKECVQNVIARLCIIREGHPDNAIACAYGGAQSILNEDTRHPEATGLGKPCFRLLVNPAIQAAIIIPERKTSTAEARAIMPSVYSKENCISQFKNIMTVLRGLETGDLRMIKSAFENEQFHIPYRGSINPHLSLLQDFIKGQQFDYGVMTCTLSGSGSTLLVLTDNPSNLDCLEAFVAKMNDTGMPCRQKRVAMGGNGIRFL